MKQSNKKELITRRPSVSLCLTPRASEAIEVVISNVEHWDRGDQFAYTPLIEINNRLETIEKNSIGVLTMSRDDRTRQWNWFNLGYAQYYGLSMLYRKHNLHNSFSCMDICLHSTGTFLLFLER